MKLPNNTRRMKYDNPPSPGEAGGIAIIKIPVKQLTEQFVLAFARQVLAHLDRGPVQNSISTETVLQQLDISREWIECNAWLEEVTQRFVAPTTTAERDKLADAVTGLADDDGEWIERQEDVDVLRDEYAERAEKTLKAIRKKVLSEYDPKKTRDVLESLRTQLYARSEALSNASSPWNVQHGQMVYQLAEQIRRLGRSQHSLWRKWSRRVHFGADGLTLSPTERTRLNAVILPQANQLCQCRMQQLVLKGRREYYERLLGKNGHPAMFDHVLHDLQRRADTIQRVRDLLRKKPARSLAFASPVIPVVASLTARLGPQTRKTFLHLCLERVAQVGKTAQDLADRLQQQGLLVANRRRLVAEWPDVPTATLARAFLMTVHAYLGVSDGAPICWRRPQTGLDALGTITLLDPALKELLRDAIQQLTARSLPFVQLNGVKPIPNRRAILYCLPEHRDIWLNKLEGKAELVEAGTPEQLALRDPYTVILFQHDFALPLGALKDFDRWKQNALELERRGESYVFDNTRETRLLAERPSEFTDVVALFESACNAGLVVSMRETTPTRYTLARPDPAVEPHLLAHRTIARVQHVEDLPRLLEQPDFLSLCEQLFPDVAELRSVLAELRRLTDLEQMALRLKELGVVLLPCPKHFQMAAVPPGMPWLSRAVQSLYRTESRGLQGLTLAGFRSLLDSNDNVLNVLYWQLREAVQTKRIGPADVPPWVLRAPFLAG